MSFFGMSGAGKDARGWQNEYLRWQQEQMKNQLGQSQEAFDRSGLATNKYEADMYNQYGQGSNFLNDPYANWNKTQQDLMGQWGTVGNEMTQRINQLNPASQASQAATARSYAPAYASAQARLKNINPSDPQYQAAMGRLDQSRARGMDENLANRTAGWVNAANQNAQNIYGVGAGLKQGLAQGGVDQAMAKYGVQNQLLDKLNNFGQQQQQQGMNMNQNAQNWGNQSAQQAARNYQMESADANWGGKLLGNLGMMGLSAFAPGFGTAGFQGFMNPFKKAGGASSGLRVAGMF